MRQRYTALLGKLEHQMERLWNGSYYLQEQVDINQYKYQYGTGCLSDQLFGQLLARLAGLGQLLPEEHIKTALTSILQYNYRTSFREVYNCQRAYATGNDQGLLLCSWPKGGRPQFPFIYSDEVWAGVEYQVATHMLYAGLTQEAQTLVAGCRQRYDGTRYNPWDEIECGHNYLRSMASWGLLVAASGFACNVYARTICFSPSPLLCRETPAQTFFCCGAGWGVLHLEADTKRAVVQLYQGNLHGYHIQVDGYAEVQLIPAVLE